MEDLKQLATAASLITQAVKNNKTMDTTVLVELITENLIQFLTVDEIITIITTAGYEQGKVFNDIYDLVHQWQVEALQVISDIDNNTLWQNLAQLLYWSAIGLKGFLPKPWKVIITEVLEAYEVIKGK